MVDKLPQTQEEARSLIAQRMDAIKRVYEQEKAAGTLTRQKEMQLVQQFRDLDKQFSVASTGTEGSVGKGLISGINQGFGFYGQGANLAAPILTMPSRIAQAAMNFRFGRPVNEPQSQEQLVPFRAGQGVGNLATGMLTPGNTVRSVATGAGLTAADIGIESQGGPQSLASLSYLAAFLGRSGWKGMKSWREGRKFDDLLNKLPEDMPELERNALKRFMLTGQGSDNGIVAAAMQKLETKPEFAEMLKKLREGATEQTLSGMRPEGGKLTKEQAGTGLVQTIQNKLDGLKETVAKTIFDPDRLSLYDKAKGYGGGKAIVDPTKTVDNIDKLIKEFEAKNTPDAENSIKALKAVRERFAPTFTTEARGSTQYVVDQGITGNTVAGTPAGTRIENRVVTTYDSLGIPQTKTVQVEVPYSGTPAFTSAGKAPTMGTIPGAPSITVQQNVRPVTIEQVQGVLSEFGKKASTEDRLLQNLSISSEQRISSAIFGGMQDDIKAALGAVTDPNDRKALTLLRDARTQTAAAAERYNNAVAQGMPAFLKDVNPASLDFSTLAAQYEKLTPPQRASVRQWVGDTDPEILKQFDRQVYTNFLDKARDADGMVDLGKLTSLWNSTKTADRDAVVTALGVNAGEFNARMRDATAFNNRIRVAQPSAEANVISEAAPPLARLAGSTIGYTAHQGVMLTADVAKQLLDKTKLTDDQLMKLLLSNEGADFLKTQKLTPGSAELLDKITKVTAPTAPATGVVQQVGAQAQAPEVAPVAIPELPPFQMVDDEVPQQEQVPVQPEQQQQPAFQMVD
jgi:hypothetical protein